VTYKRPRADRHERRLETGLAAFTLGSLLIYAPLELWYSDFQFGDPMLIVDLIAMLLMAWGGVHSLRARPEPSPGLLCGAWGFACCLGYRSFFSRVMREQHIEDELLWIDDAIKEPPQAMVAVGVMFGIATVCFLVSLRLVAHRPAKG